ncbi:glycine zipper domain-containing protein [Shinella sp. BYT-45]|uniref:glycine zipper domain-containing protein n=1 Tax=Shinella sp. BYT-45 TaxID=3377377 RepID=UPI0039807779
MATGLFSSRSKSLRNGLHAEAQAVEDQIAELREEIASLARVLANDASSGAGGIRKKARAVKAEVSDAAHGLKDRAENDIRDMIAAGEDILADLQARYQDSGRKARKAVHDHPLATLGVAAAAGFLLAALLRR